MPPQSLSDHYQVLTFFPEMLLTSLWHERHANIQTMTLFSFSWQKQKWLHDDDLV